MADADRLIENVLQRLRSYDGWGTPRLDGAVAYGLSADEERRPDRLSRDVWAAGMSALGGLWLSRQVAAYAELAAERCQSPVEETMFVGLLLAALMKHAVPVVPSTALVSPPCCDDPVIQQESALLLVCPQHSIGDVHVDFRVSFYALAFDEGQKPPRYLRRATGTVLVECDGHDFHERTREQARRDKRRDRELQKLGFPVFRYTGSDVWRDPLGAALEVVDEAIRRCGPLA